jgi:CRISPR-associated protein Csx10
MYQLKYQITTLSPVIISASTGDTNMVATHEYIPGCNVFGLFAGKYIQNKPLNSDAHKDEEFYSWFLRGNIKFTNAYIVSEDEYNGLRANYPVPFSIQQEKSNEKRMYDFLYEDVDVQTRNTGGFGRLEGDSLYKESVQKSLNFHHQRDPETGTSKEGLIFNYESIDEGQTFAGTILGSRVDLEKFLEFFGREHKTFIGRSRNTQYGKVSLKIVAPEPEEYISVYSRETSNNVSMTLLSDTIIYNEYGFPTTEVDELASILGCKIVKSFIRTGEIESFVSIWRLRKPSERCFLAGSCFILEVSETDTDRLLELERDGIGERTGEGFGRIVLGLQEEPELLLADPKSGGIVKPDFPIPLKTKEIVRKVIEGLIQKKVKLKAMEEAASFRYLPSASLISRLDSMIQSMDKRSMDKTDFHKSLESLRDTARNKLQRCRNRYQTLLDYLMEKDLTIAETLNDSSLFESSTINKINNLLRETGLRPEQNRDFESDLYRLYLSNFLSAIKNRIKMGEN